MLTLTIVMAKALANRVKFVISKAVPNAVRVCA